MKKFVVLVSLAAVFAGCSNDPVPSEAELFGYKGRDLIDPDDTMFFTTGPGVTNWVPSRVLTVIEHYEFSTNELSLVAAAGIITPGAALEKIPEPYVERSREP